MMKRRTVFIIFFCIVCIILASLGAGWVWTRSESSKQIVYYRVRDNLDVKQSSLDIVKTIHDVAGRGGLEMVRAERFGDANFVLFESLNDIDRNMKVLGFGGGVRYVYGLRGSDMMASKSALARVMRDRLGAKRSGDVLPVTYIVEDGREVDRLVGEYREGEVYVMKKNIQQQKGFVLSGDLREILEKLKSDAGYVVVQRVLQDPFLVKGYKCNMRVYMLVVVRPGGGVEWYYYDNGFMYYTVEPWRANSVRAEEVITTGLAGRAMYADKPLTHRDFMGWLGDERAGVLRRELTKTIQAVCDAYSGIVFEENRLIGGGTKFLVYGVDIAPDVNLKCKIMEINKGPDLSYKDERDREVKIGMVRNAMALAGVVKGTPSGYIPLYVWSTL